MYTTVANEIQVSAIAKHFNIPKGFPVVPLISFIEMMLFVKIAKCNYWVFILHCKHG